MVWTTEKYLSKFKKKSVSETTKLQLKEPNGELKPVSTIIEAPKPIQEVKQEGGGVKKKKHSILNVNIDPNVKLRKFINFKI